MTPIREYLKVNLNDDPNNITNQYYVENTVENPAWYTVEDNHASLISEDVDKVIKVETDLLDDCMWQSRIDIAKFDDNCSSSLLANVYQDTSNNNFNNSNPKVVNCKESFLCYICGQPFALNFDLEHHLKLHEEPTQNSSSCNGDMNNEIQNHQSTFLCHVCGENFNLDFDFRNHIEEHNKKTQNALDNKSDSNCENKKLLKTFCCDICEKWFALELDLNNHLREHINSTQLNKSVYKCNFCEEEFKLNFLLNRHIKKCQKPNINHVVNMSECNICKVFVNEAKYDEHVKTHKSSVEEGTDCIVNLKLSKLNGVWKSKPNLVYKCNICEDKFQNEICITEHMQIHKNDVNQKRSENSLITTPIYNSNNYIQQIHDNNNLKCQKCNSKFEKKENLDLHIIYCTKSSRDIWNKFLGSQMIEKDSVVCTVCGISFSSPQLLNIHKTSGCRLHICTFCQKSFKTKEVWSKHIDVCRKENKCDCDCDCNININKSGVNEAQNQNILKNTSNPKLRKENGQCSRLSLRKMSDLLDNSADIDHSIFEPSNLIINKSSVRIKRLKISCPNVFEKKLSVVLDAGKNEEITKQTVMNNVVNKNQHTNVEKNKSLCLNGIQQNNLYSQDTENISETFVQDIQSDLIVNNCHPFIKKEKDLSTTVNDIHTLIQENSPKNYDDISLPEPHNVMSFNCNVDIKREREVNTNLAESINFDQTEVANTPECIVLTETSQGIVKREPENVESNNIVEWVERETIYFTIKETTIKGNVSSNTNYYNCDQILGSNILCVCKICKESSLTDLHALAVHMSNHKECSMHECVVCNETFETVFLWKDHMMYHQEQADLILSGAHNSSVRIESSVPDTSCVESTEPETITTMGNTKNVKYARMKREFKNSHSENVPTKSSINVNKLKLSHFNSTLPYQTIRSIMKSFSCKYCDRTFSGQGPLTNHEKSHTNPNKNKLLVPNIDNTLTELDQAQTNFDMQVTNNMVNFGTIQPQLINVKYVPKRFVCRYCPKKFTRKCHRTNHMRFVHKKILKSITPKTSTIENHGEINEIVSINANEQSLLPSLNVELIKDIENNLSVSESANSNKINVNSKGNEAYCTICKKKFAHIGALASHMNVHSNRKPFKCRYCNRKFNMKGPYTLHVRKHNKIVDVENLQTQNLLQVKVEMGEIKDKEEQIQSEVKENSNDSEFLDVNLNNNLNCTNSIKKNRTWFVCDVCDKKFSTPFQLILHRRLLHDAISPYTCKICDRTYSVRHCWNRHIKSHYRKNDGVQNLKNGLHTNDTRLVGRALKSNEYQNQFKCGYCKKEYSLIYHWKKHLSLSKECRRHCKSNVPEFTSVQAKNNYTISTRYECRICMKTYSTDYNRKVHLRNVHQIKMGTISNVNMQTQDLLTVETPIKLKLNIPKKRRRRGSFYKTAFKCDVCGKCYSNANNLSRHRKLAHSEINGTITCNICCSTFKHKYSYREHCKVKHKFLLQTDNGLNLNAIINNNGASQKVPQKNNTVQHPMKSTKTQHAKNKYECKDCGQNFDTNIILGQHIFLNHPIKNVSNSSLHGNIVNTPSSSNNGSTVKCNICLKMFSSMSYLSQHMRMHSGIKPFKCDVCNMAFRFRPNLKIHQKRHNVAVQ